MKQPIITFVLIAYNQETFIKEAVEAALAQTYNPLEIILSDDCSKDSTFKIIQEIVSIYSGPHKIILNQNETNLGLCAHVNKAFQMGSGEWIVAAAGDDISLPDRCQKLYEATLDVPYARAVTSAWTRIDEKGNELPYNLSPRYMNGRVDYFGEEKWVKRYVKSQDIGTCGATAMWSKVLFEQFGNLPESVPAEDAVLSYRAYLTGSVIYLNSKLVKYRTHADNICNTTAQNFEATEVRSNTFSRKSMHTVEAIKNDYQLYLKSHSNKFNELNGLKLIKWSIDFVQTRCDWWNKGVGWRTLKAIKSLLSGNIIEAKWRVSRIAGLKVAKIILKIKRRFF